MNNQISPTSSFEDSADVGNVHGYQPVQGFEYTLPESCRNFEDFLKNTFKLERRRVTVRSELYAGLMHFVSCLYVLPVIPQQMKNAGYDPRSQKNNVEKTMNNKYLYRQLGLQLSSVLCVAVSVPLLPPRWPIYLSLSVLLRLYPYLLLFFCNRIK